MRAAIVALLIALASSSPASQFVLHQPPIPGRRPPPQSHDFLSSHNLKPELVMGTLAQYREAVQLYRRDQRLQAINALDKLTRAQVEFIMETIRSQRRSHHAEDSPVFDWPRVDLAAAGMLHGDLAIAKLEKEDFEDELRLTLSMLMIADMPRHHTDERPETWTRDWLRATGAALLAERAWGPLEILLAYAGLLDPDDGPLLLVRGTLRELQCTSAALPIASTYAEGPPRTVRDRDTLRQDAVDTLTRSVHAMPDSDEAAVRLAHMRIELRQDAKAATLLDRVLASDASAWWYLAALMRGSVYERTGDLPAAEGLYRRLIDRFPQTQTPYLALAMLQYTNGRREDSANTLDRMYARPQALGRADPWWQYAINMGPAALEALDHMRRSVRE